MQTVTVKYDPATDRVIVGNEDVCVISSGSLAIKPNSLCAPVYLEGTAFNWRPHQEQFTMLYLNRWGELKEVFYTPAKLFKAIKNNKKPIKGYIPPIGSMGSTK